MEQYRGLLDDFERGWLNVQPKAFPFMTFEHTVWVIVGSETQQSTSLIFTFSNEDKKSWENPTRMVWNSLTDMFSVDLSDWNN